MAAGPDVSISSKEFWARVMIFISVSMDRCAYAFPEYALLYTTKGLMLRGSLLTPEPMPAFSFTDSLGARAFPVLLLDRIMTFAPVC